MSDDWDVDLYKTEFENEDHWQLKRNFMLAHKDKFPEDELVCLAQVFTNIEFMGCRYPDKTMIRVAELAKGVVEKYREQRKDSLKRTFVAASDAASAKVKGQVCKGEEPVSPKKSKNMGETEKKSNADELTVVQETPSTKMKVSKYGGVKTFNIKQNEQTCLGKNMEVTDSTKETNEGEKYPEKFDGPLGDFVLFLGSTDEHPVSIIQRNALINKCAIKWDFEEEISGIFVCKLFLNNQCIALSTGETMKISKEHTAMVAIAKLRETYYGIRVKSKFISDSTISPAQLGFSSITTTTTTVATSTTTITAPGSSQLGEDNVGMKLMKLMGWQGGGLGSKGQGRKEPVTAALQVKRGGLGLDKATPNIFEFKIRAREYVNTWMKSDSDQDLVFCSDFSTEERKALHEIASSLSLKSKSYGKDGNRQIIISRKYHPWDILKDLLRKGGDSDRFELLRPTNT